MLEFATRDGAINSYGDIRVKSIEDGSVQLEQHLWRFNKGEDSSVVRSTTIDMKKGDTSRSIEERLNSRRNYYINDDGVLRDITTSN